MHRFGRGPCAGGCGTGRWGREGRGWGVVAQMDGMYITYCVVLVALLYCIDCICIVVFRGNRLEKCSYPIGVSRVHTRKTPQGTYFVSRWCEPASFAAGECWREGLEHRPTAVGDTRNNRMRENDVNRTTMNCVLFKVFLVVVVVVRTTSPATTTHHTTTQRTNGTNGTNRTTWSTT